jgi:transcription initiation factor TFIID TATA-box-binding protein
MPDVEVCNIISSLNLNQSVDLNAFAKRYERISKYRIGKFPGLSLRFESPKATILLFKNGKAVCTGTKTEKCARETFKKMIKMMKLVENDNLFNFKIHNFVASCNFGFNVDLYKVYNACKSQCSYEPEIFPALYYKCKNPRVTVILFHTGKFIITGCKFKHLIYRVSIIVCSILENFKINC